MTIDLISNNTLKISLSKKDMSEFNIDYDILDKKNPETQIFILNLIEIVKEKKDIDLCSEKLYIEAFPQVNGGCLLYLSVLNEIIKEPKKIYTGIVCETNSIMDLINICNKLYNQCNYLIKISKLYYLNGKYRLILYIYSDADKKINYLLDEYQIENNTNEILISFTKEHFAHIINKNAIETISQLALE